MHQQNEGILVSLGLTEEALLRARKIDSVLDEMCSDLEDLANALDTAEGHEPKEPRKVPDQHMIRLISELESEIRLRLRTMDSFENTTLHKAEKD
ncbi:MAG: hypothetical protein ABJN98_05010 [Roseibium sp.]